MTEVTDSVALRAVVCGVVQGVSFCYFVVQKARDLGSTGYVRNLSDGHSVDVVAERSREGLDALLRLLRQGPPEARVKEVDTWWSEASGDYERFSMAFREPSARRLLGTTPDTAVVRNG
jgi:acylphosphatase